MRTSSHLRLGNDALSHQVKRDVLPVEKPAPRAKKHTRLKRGGELERTTPLERGSTPPARTPLGRTTEDQKLRVAGRACIVCGEHGGDCHPAHVVPRSHPKMSEEAANDRRAVVPLCFHHHRSFDDGQLDLCPYLEPKWRDSQEWAAGAVGLATAIRSITGSAA